jgi:hypothetical protein
VIATSTADPSLSSSAAVVIAGTDLRAVGVDANVHAFAQAGVPGCDSLIWSPGTSLIFSNSTTCSSSGTESDGSSSSAISHASQSWSVTGPPNGVQTIAISMHADGQASVDAGGTASALADGSSHIYLCFRTTGVYNYTLEGTLSAGGTPWPGYAETFFLGVYYSAGNNGTSYPPSVTVSRSGVLPAGSYCLRTVVIAGPGANGSQPVSSGTADVTGLTLKLTPP